MAQNAITGAGRRLRWSHWFRLTRSLSRDTCRSPPVCGPRMLCPVAPQTPQPDACSLSRGRVPTPDRFRYRMIDRQESPLPPRAEAPLRPPVTRSWKEAWRSPQPYSGSHSWRVLLTLSRKASVGDDFALRRGEEWPGGISLGANLCPIRCTKGPSTHPTHEPESRTEDTFKDSEKSSVALVDTSSRDDHKDAPK